MYDPEDHIKTSQGLHWYRTAGAWADAPIQPSPLKELDALIVKVEYVEGCFIDPRHLVGTCHASYNQGMTWRRFLHGGKRIEKNLVALEKSAVYYDDPIAATGQTDTWHVVDIDGALFSSSSNHRGVIAKFRAHEDLITLQLVHSVRRYVTNQDARAQHRQLQEVYLPGQKDFGIEKRLVSDDRRIQSYETVVTCDLRVGNKPIVTLPLEKAASVVRRKNRYYRKLHRLSPFLWRLLSGVDQ